LDPIAAAETTAAAAAATNLGPHDPQRVGVLEGLDRRVAGVRHVGLQRRGAVPTGAGAMPSREGLVVRERSSGARVDASDQEVVPGAAARGRTAIGRRL